MVKLYKIPNIYIIGIVGEFGTGKSLLLTRHSLELANQLHKGIATNIDLDFRSCINYCKKFKLDWFAKNGFIKIIKNPQKLLSQENKIIVFDEIGIDLFARGFGEESRKALIDRIVRPRHYKNIILYGAQGKEQIDKQLRERTQLYIWNKAFAPYSYKHQRSNLLFRQSFYFDKQKFETFSDEFNEEKWIYPYWASGFRFEWGILTNREKALFKCYNSFDKREKKRGRKYEYVDGNFLNSSNETRETVSRTLDLSKLFGVSS